MRRVPIAARFYGGPWNAQTREVDRGSVVIRASEDPPLIPFPLTDEEGAEPCEVSIRVGIYRQNTDHPNRYEWEGWSK